MFLVIKNKLNKFLCYMIVFTTLIIANVAVQSSTLAVSTPLQKFCVVLDAGHGGIDVGCIGPSGAYESDINLKISKKVERLLTTLGIRVVQTRKTEDGLYGVFANGFKRRDMEARRKVILESNPNLVVSIHLNAYTTSKSRGAQVFYAMGSDVSKELAECMQKLFIENLPNARKSVQAGDFYILNCSDTPGVLVECGFLSNPEEEKLLCSDEYQERVAYQISCGILQYFDLTGE